MFTSSCQKKKHPPSSLTFQNRCSVVEPCTASSQDILNRICIFTNDNKYAHLGGSGAYVSCRAIRTSGTLHKKCVLYQSWNTFHLEWVNDGKRLVQRTGYQDNTWVTLVEMATNPVGLDLPSLLQLNHNPGCKLMHNVWKGHKRNNCAT